MSDLFQIIYRSQPFGFDETSLAGILLDARRCNSRDGITGALVCRHDIFVQLLEGPEDAVRATFRRIERDDRHVNVVQLVGEGISERLFGDWAMLHDPADSEIWSEAEVAEGAAERATPADVREMFAALREAQGQGRMDA
ncbi:MAG: BLUF domain-containing protein [Boseongicola sp.]|nr:BLUF domain-containing protein [Boseongicola sp.]